MPNHTIQDDLISLSLKDRGGLGSPGFQSSWEQSGSAASYTAHTARQLPLASSQTAPSSADRKPSAPRFARICVEELVTRMNALWQGSHGCSEDGIAQSVQDSSDAGDDIVSRTQSSAFRDASAAEPPRHAQIVGSATTTAARADGDEGNNGDSVVFGSSNEDDEVNDNDNDTQQKSTTLTAVANDILTATQHGTPTPTASQGHSRPDESEIDSRAAPLERSMLAHPREPQTQSPEIQQAHGSASPSTTLFQRQWPARLAGKEEPSLPSPMGTDPRQQAQAKPCGQTLASEAAVSGSPLPAALADHKHKRQGQRPAAKSPHAHCTSLQAPTPPVASGEIQNRDPCSAKKESSRGPVYTCPSDHREPQSNTCNDQKDLSHHPQSQHLSRPRNISPPLVIFDVRPLEAYQNLRIKGSIPVALPALVVRRIRRSSVAESMATPATSNSPAALALDNLMTYVPTLTGKRKLEDTLHGLGRAMSSTENVQRRSKLAHASTAGTQLQSSSSSSLNLWKADVIVVCERPADGNAGSSTSGPSFASSSTPSVAGSPSVEAAEALCMAIESAQESTAPAIGTRIIYDEPLSATVYRAGSKRWLQRGSDESSGSTSWTSSDESAQPYISSSALSISPKTTLGGDGISRRPTSPCTASLAASLPFAALSGRSGKGGRPSLTRLNTGDGIRSAHQPRPFGSAPSLTPSLYVDAGQKQTNFKSSSASVSPALHRSACQPVQTFAHHHAMGPASPAAFGEMSLPVPGDASITDGLLTPAQADRALTRHASPSPMDRKLRSPYIGSPCVGSIAPGRDEDSPHFDVSTVVPSFLFLGPDITSWEEVETLRHKGVKRILNCAAEINDRAFTSLAKPQEGSTNQARSIAPARKLAETFEGYHKIPMWDNVEAVGVQEHLAEACTFLDQARSSSSPVYVHCRAGKSRSVSVVIAYLIQANKWSLKKAYQHVLEQRPDISPNIGFVSCLMDFEERVLGRKSQGLVGGDES